MAMKALEAICLTGVRLSTLSIMNAINAHLIEDLEAIRASLCNLKAELVEASKAGSEPPEQRLERVAAVEDLVKMIEDAVLMVLENEQASATGNARPGKTPGGKAPGHMAAAKR